jgi:hypothetical protein
MGLSLKSFSVCKRQRPKHVREGRDEHVKEERAGRLHARDVDFCGEVALGRQDVNNKIHCPNNLIHQHGPTGRIVAHHPQPR